MLDITSFLLGPVYTNTYLVADSESKEAVIIDPADSDCSQIIQKIKENGWTILQIWITHAHFDHTAGIEALFEALGRPIPVALHPADIPLWQDGGSGKLFGMAAEHAFDPDVSLSHGETLHVGGQAFEVRHVPGHSQGHVVFYNSAEKVLFCGDLIFRQSIGRTDFPEGNYDALMHSIRTQVMTLPPETRLLPGHGENTTVGLEEKYNPFLH